MSLNLPSDVDHRPVLVIGAGTLGARIALMFAAGGSPVRSFNRSAERADGLVEIGRWAERGVARKAAVRS